MLSRRTDSSTNRLGLILGLIILLVLVILILLMVIWRWKLRSKPRCEPTLRGLILLGGHSEKYSALNSTSPAVSMFKFPQKNSDDTPSDVKAPFCFLTPLRKPVPLASLSHARAFTAIIAPPAQKADMDKSPMPSPQYSPVSYKKDSMRDDPEGWKSSYYAETLPDSRPPSYCHTPNGPLGHSLVPNPMRSGPFPGFLSRTPYANSGTRSMSQVIGNTVSMDVDSPYVESLGGDGQAAGSDKISKIMSAAPRIPSIYFGVPFGAFANLEGEPEERTVDYGNFGESTSPKCVRDEPQRVNAIHSFGQGLPPVTITAGIKHQEKTTGKNRQAIPPGWFQPFT